MAFVKPVAPVAITAVAHPIVQQLQQRLNALESERNRETQARLQRTKVEADSAVEAFAADPANVYFNEVASDMAQFVKQYMGVAQCEFAAFHLQALRCP